jgi:hypothetical protein
MEEKEAPFLKKEVGFLFGEGCRSGYPEGSLTNSLPYVFTEQGVAMLSSILNSDRAIEINILIMRAFVKLREMIATHKDLARRLDDQEKKYDSQFKVVFEAIRQPITLPVTRKRKIGFHLKEMQGQ